MFSAVSLSAHCVFVDLVLKRFPLTRSVFALVCVAPGSSLERETRSCFVVGLVSLKNLVNANAYILILP